MKNQIPDRWLPYQALGQRIPGTRFISFKVPLKTKAVDTLPEEMRFTPEMLLEQCPTLQFIVDLTNTDRYYSREVFTDRGITYKKIKTPGHVIPGAKYVKEFFDTVDAFLSAPAEPDSLIGVHCTHGLNRTSYFICCYMIHRLGFKPRDAITAFEEARGHKVERPLYVEDLLKGGMGSKDEAAPVRRDVHRRHTPYERPRDHRTQHRPPHHVGGAPPPAPYQNPYARSGSRYAQRSSHYNDNSRYDWRTDCRQQTEKSFGYGDLRSQGRSRPPPHGVADRRSGGPSNERPQKPTQRHGHHSYVPAPLNAGFHRGRGRGNGH